MATWAADRNGDGEMSAQEIYDWASPRATDYVRRYMYDVMYPRFFDNHPGDLVVMALPPCGLPACQIGSSPLNPVIGEEVCFDSGAFSDCGISGVDWDFGDGTTGSGESACHTYTRAATFAVSCTVTDSAGYQRTCSSSVRVHDENCHSCVGLVTCSCNMPSGKVGQTKSGQIAARNWRDEDCLVRMRVFDNAGTAVFDRTVTIGPRSRVSLRFSHQFTQQEVGRGSWRWEVWPQECAELTACDNTRTRQVKVESGVPAGCPGYCQAVLGACVRYLGFSPAAAVEIEAAPAAPITFTQVTTGTLLCVDAASLGLSQLPAETWFRVLDANGNVVREDLFDTSCTQPIYPGQPFGPFQVVEAYYQPCT
jgi:hypothetical protein